MRDYTTPITRIASLPEMRAALDQELERVRGKHGLKEDDRSIFERHLAHYVLAHYLSQPPERRDAMLLEGRRIMEEKRRMRLGTAYWDMGDPEPADVDGGIPAVESIGPEGKDVAPPATGRQRRRAAR